MKKVNKNTALRIYPTLLSQNADMQTKINTTTYTDTNATRFAQEGLPIRHRVLHDWSTVKVGLGLRLANSLRLHYARNQI